VRDHHQKGMVVHEKGMVIHEKGMVIHEKGMVVHQKGMVIHEKDMVIPRVGWGVLVRAMAWQGWGQRVRAPLGQVTSTYYRVVMSITLKRTP